MPLGSTLTIVLIAVFVVIVGAIAVIAFQERSPRRTKRRAKGGAKKFAFGASLGIAGLVGALEGFGMGIAGGIGQIGSVFIANPNFVVDLGLIGLGAFVVSGNLAISLPIFLTVSLLIVSFGLALKTS
ncbi:hypothetical protein [Halobellus limi]|uniref:Uncharacterized protein n=1 Tax=Halobellus limi TaxID=699433 RepID=A0A1H5SNM9_9EURY|nr:hypothetical protein [Halobellus limi]QCC47535.1 hypothetical protein DV707_07590 [Halobellus limi]SEF52179.1 hypothetical protein SAMN04488133_0028 [Halobellus limi]